MSSRFRRSGFRRTYGSRIRSRSRFSRSYGNNALVKRARGNLKAAASQTDSTDTVINLIHSCYTGVDGILEANGGMTAVTNWSTVGVQAINVYDMLRKSTFYQSYANMYDQFRITSIKVKITPTQWSTFDQAQSTVNATDSVKESYTNTVPTALDNVIYYYNPKYKTQQYITQNGQQVPQYDDQGRPIMINKPPTNPVPPYSVDSPLYIAEGWNPDTDQGDFDSLGVAMYKQNGTVANYNALADGNGIYPETVIDSTNIAKLKYVINTTDTTTSVEKTPIETGQYTPLFDMNKNYVYPQALTIVTAWDRSGLDQNQLLKLNGKYAHVVETNTWEKVGYELGEANDLVVYIHDDITSYSSAQTKQLISGSAFNCVRYLYPSSQQEKSLFYSTSSLMPQYGDNYNNYYYRSLAAEENPEYLTCLNSHPSVPFKPTLLVGVLGHGDAKISPTVTNGKITYANFIKPIKLNLEFDIGVTFRGLRKSQVVSPPISAQPNIVNLTKTIYSNDSTTNFEPNEENGDYFGNVSISVKTRTYIKKLNKYGGQTIVSISSIVGGTSGDLTSGDVKGYRTVNSDYTLATNYLLLCVGYDATDSEFVLKVYQNQKGSNITIPGARIQYWYVVRFSTTGEDGNYINFKAGGKPEQTMSLQDVFNIRDFNGSDTDAAAVYLDKDYYCIPDLIKNNANGNIVWSNIYPDVNDPMHSYGS